MNRASQAFAVAASALVVGSSASAQSLEAYTGYVALLVGPIGGLAVTPPSGLVADAPDAPVVSVMVGKLNGSDPARTFTVGLQFELPTPLFSSVTLGVGRFIQECNCVSHAMFMVRGMKMLVATREDSTTVRSFRAAVQLSGGIASVPDIPNYSAALELPVALRFTGKSYRFAPFVTPGVGRGWVVNHDKAVHGDRAILSGGISVEDLARRVTLSAGMKRILITGERYLYGVSVSLAP